MYHTVKLLTVPLFVLYAINMAFADTWEDVRNMTWDATAEFNKEAYDEEKRFEKELELQHDEILQQFNFHKVNAESAIHKCDSAFYEAAEKSAVDYVYQEKRRVRSQRDLHAKEITQLKARYAKHEESYERYFKQLEELPLLERLTTGRHKELLELTASAYIEKSRTYEQLKTAEFKHKQLDQLIWLLMVTRWDIKDYPTDCVVETYEKPDGPVAQKPKDVECLAIISGEETSPLCVASKDIIYDPEDGHIADATWALVHMDGKPARDGIEMSIHARLSFANGSPVGRGEITYGGSKTEKGGMLIFHWNVSPDYRAVVKPVNAEGSGATLTIKSQ